MSARSGASRRPPAWQRRWWLAVKLTVRFGCNSAPAPLLQQEGGEGNACDRRRWRMKGAGVGTAVDKP